MSLWDHWRALKCQQLPLLISFCVLKLPLCCCCGPTFESQRGVLKKGKIYPGWVCVWMLRLADGSIPSPILRLPFLTAFSCSSAFSISGSHRAAVYPQFCGPPLHLHTKKANLDWPDLLSTSQLQQSIGLQRERECERVQLVLYLLIKPYVHWYPPLYGLRLVSYMTLPVSACTACAAACQMSAVSHSCIPGEKRFQSFQLQSFSVSQWLG